MLRLDPWARAERRRTNRGLVPTIVAAAGLAVGATFAFGTGHTAAVGASIWVQTMDSCREAVGSAQYRIVPTGGAMSRAASQQTASTPPVAPSSVGNGSCPLNRGDCARRSAGCTEFTNLAFPATYEITEVRTPPSNRSNPQGYAPCEGGSACQGEVAKVSINAMGRVSAVTTNVEPDGTRQLFPSQGTVPGTASDPVIFHDYGLGTGSCDGDHDADDHLTGSGPGGHCRYPEAREASACKPYPWSCGPSAAEGPAPATPPKRRSPDQDAPDTR